MLSATTFASWSSSVAINSWICSFLITSIEALAADNHRELALNDLIWRTERFNNRVAHSTRLHIVDQDGLRPIDDHTGAVRRQRRRRHTYMDIRHSSHTC